MWVFIRSKKELGFKKISSALSSGLTGRQDSGSWLNRHLHEKDLGVLIEGRLRMIPRCEPESLAPYPALKKLWVREKAGHSLLVSSVHVCWWVSFSCCPREYQKGNSQARTSVVSLIWRLGSAAGIVGRGGTWLLAKIWRNSWWFRFNPILSNRQNQDPPETGKQVYAHEIISQKLELWETQSSSLQCGGQLSTASFENESLGERL